MEEVVDGRSALKKSLPHALQHSIEMVSLRTSARLSGKAYNKVDGPVLDNATDSADPGGSSDEGPDNTDSATESPVRGVRLVSSAHMELMRQITCSPQPASPDAGSFGASRASDNASPTRSLDGSRANQSGVDGRDDSSTLELCQDVVAGRIERASDLVSRLTGDATECLLTLRTNMFWPMLARAVENASRDLPVEPILACVDAVVQQPLSAAVLEAQMLGNNLDDDSIDDDDAETASSRLDHVAIGLSQCGAAALPFALRLASLATKPDDLVEPLVDAILMTRVPLDASLVRPFAHAVMLATPNDADLLERSVHYLLGCGYLAELLFVCRVPSPTVRRARSAALHALATTRNDEVRARLDAIWSHGLTTARFNDLRDVFDTMRKKRAAALVKHCFERAADAAQTDE